MSRNPLWTRQELTLAIELYFRRNPASMNANDQEVARLSAELRNLPINKGRASAPTFRNTNSVYMKLCNFLRLDPSYAGKGLRRGSKLEEEIWNHYANDRTALQAAVQALRTVGAPPFEAPSSTGRQVRVWGVQSKPHHRDRLEEFLSLGIVAIGWPSLRFDNLERADIQALLEKYHSGDDARTISARAGAIWALANEMAAGDYVLVPRKSGFFVGEIAGPYRYDKAKSSEREGYPNQRPVKWLQPEPFPRSLLPKAVASALRWRFPPVIEMPIAPEELLQAISRGPATSRPTATRSRSTSRPIGHKEEMSYAFARQKGLVTVSRIHNKLINDFNAFLGRNIRADEGDYDVLIHDWQKGRALLVEAKSKGCGGDSRHQLREALGQLLDYRFMLERNGLRNIDLALLTPEEPDDEMKELFQERLKIDMIWRDEGKGFVGTEGLRAWLASRH